MVVRRLDLEERVDLDNDDTGRDSGPPGTVFVASTKKYDFVRRVEGSVSSVSARVSQWNSKRSE
jgi:hypothetical protein